MKLYQQQGEDDKLFSEHPYILLASRRKQLQQLQQIHKNNVYILHEKILLYNLFPEYKLFGTTWARFLIYQQYLEEQDPQSQSQPQPSEIEQEKYHRQDKDDKVISGRFLNDIESATFIRFPGFDITMTAGFPHILRKVKVLGESNYRLSYFAIVAVGNPYVIKFIHLSLDIIGSNTHFIKDHELHVPSENDYFVDMYWTKGRRLNEDWFFVARTNLGRSVVQSFHVKMNMFHS